MQGISVIIPTLNRTDFLITTLKDLVVQKCTFPFEIIIVDQSNEPDIDVINFGVKPAFCIYGKFPISHIYNGSSGFETCL